MRNETQRDKLLRRWSMLETERSSWTAHWRDLSEHILPRNGRFFISDRNKGNRDRQNRLYDSASTRAARILGAGMLSGLTSPARPWFRLTTADRDMAEFQSVKVWLAGVTRMMQHVFSASNTYRALHNTYEELGVFGVAASTVLDDYDDAICFYPHTIGEYALGTNYRGKVDTMYREFEKTVGQLVKEFGRDNCSTAVKNLFDQGNLDAWVPIIHAVEPREDRDPSRRDSRNMPFRSTYFEKGRTDDGLLRDGGFERFRVLAPRWVTIGQDIYGSSCPGMEALGDARQLQHQQMRKSQAIDYQTRPPLQAPMSMKHQAVDILPGGLTYVDMAGPSGGVKASFEAQLRLDYLLSDIQDVRGRINSAFYADLFLMLANMDQTRMTATEVAQRHEEKLLMLGPVLERLHNESLDPLIEITFERLLRAGALPPPPEEMAGQELDVEFVSVLAQAQRAVGLNSIDRFVGNLGVIAQMKSDVLDKFDADQWVDVYADNLGLDPSVIVADEQVALVRQERAAQQQAAVAQEQALAAAQTMNQLGQVDTSGKNAATDVLTQLTGYGSPGAQTY